MHPFSIPETVGETGLHSVKRDRRASDRNVPHLAPGHRVHWEEAEHAYVLLYPEGMVTLDLLAGEVLRRCDGNTPVGEIIQTLLHVHYPDLASRASIMEFLRTALAKGWIYLT